MTATRRLRGITWTAALDRSWRSPANLHEAARAVAAQVVGIGQMLPLTQFADARVFPIINWRPEALQRRLTSGHGPVLDLQEVYRQVSACHDGWPTALRMIGFLGVDALAGARRQLAGLRSMGRTVALVPAGASPRRATLMEFDVQGTAVVATSPDLHVLVGGDPGVRAGSDLSAVWRRFYEEQLFDWAQRAGTLPAQGALTQAVSDMG